MHWPDRDWHFRFLYICPSQIKKLINGGHGIDAYDFERKVVVSNNLSVSIVVLSLEVEDLYSCLLPPPPSSSSYYYYYILSPPYNYYMRKYSPLNFKF